MGKAGLRVIYRADSFIEAQLIVGLLESEGVAARTGGSELMDEFGASQRLLGPTEVIIKNEDLELATELVAAWRDGHGEAPPHEAPPEGGAPPS
ncbi:MAG: DUF2007 domain-containing protein [Planctomycetota bacterium]|nr:DUF2007 domain-containing protein [Planctomycetota bacterium]